MARHRCLVLSPRLFEVLMVSESFCGQCSNMLAETPKPPREQDAGLALHFSEDGLIALCGASLSEDALYVAVVGRKEPYA